MKNFKSACLATVQKAAPVILVCASAFATNTAQAGWIADFLCWGDNSPAQCRSYLPDALKLTKQPSSSGTSETIKIPATEKTSQAKLAVVAPVCKGGVNVWAGPDGKGGCTPSLPDLHKK